MYVIQVAGDTEDAVIGKTTTNVVLVPADRCVWTTTYNSTAGAYQLSNVRFYDGNAANGNALENNHDYQLGYVGKSGRFVGISD